MVNHEKLYPEWPVAVQEVMDEGIGMLDIPARAINQLEGLGLLTTYDLLLRTEDVLCGCIGDKAFGALRRALSKKGFRRTKARADREEALFMRYDGCYPPVDDPADLIGATPTLTEEDKQLLTYKQALERAVSQLEDVRGHYGKKTEQYSMLEWIIYHAKTRLPEPKEKEDVEES